MQTITPEHLERARKVQTEIKSFLASFPMHKAELTLQVALWYVMKEEFNLNQIENLRSELTNK